LRHLACGDPPCSIDNLRVTYAHHQPGLDMVGFEAGGGAGEAWFDSGRIRHVVQRGCVAPEFAWHEHGADDGSTYLGGPFTLAQSATIRVTFSDGSTDEAQIRPPVFVMPIREHTDDGAAILSVELFDPEGLPLTGATIPGCESHH
jgi:hypothetical protein